MEKGDVVTVYRDPVGCTALEGKARLITKLPSNFYLFERWPVVFIDGTAEYERTINTVKH